MFDLTYFSFNTTTKHQKEHKIRRISHHIWIRMTNFVP